MVLVVDESGSTRSSITYDGQRMGKYYAQRAFVNKLIGQFVLGDVNGARMAVVGFASRARLISGWTDDPFVLSSAISKTRGSGGTCVRCPRPSSCQMAGGGVGGGGGAFGCTDVVWVREARAGWVWVEVARLWWRRVGVTWYSSWHCVLVWGRA